MRLCTLLVCFWSSPPTNLVNTSTATLGTTYTLNRIHHILSSRGTAMLFLHHQCGHDHRWGPILEHEPKEQPSQARRCHSNTRAPEYWFLYTTMRFIQRSQPAYILSLSLKLDVMSIIATPCTLTSPPWLTNFLKHFTTIPSTMYTSYLEYTWWMNVTLTLKHLQSQSNQPGMYYSKEIRIITQVIYNIPIMW